MTADARFVNNPDQHKVVAAAAMAGGELTQLADSRAAYLDQLESAASGDTVALRKKAIAKVPSASATTFAKGDPIFWDESAGLAINPSLTAMDGTADYYLGVAHKAKVSGDTDVEVDFNAHPLLPLMPSGFVHEFDTEDGADETASVKNIRTIIPANMNKRGWLVLAIYGIVTEVFGGASEDQGIVTITDGDGNSLATLTPTNAGADAAGDVIVGTNKVLGGTTGDAVKTVAAGKSIRGQVTQETSGASAAGKMKVYVLVMPLL